MRFFILFIHLVFAESSFVGFKNFSNAFFSFAVGCSLPGLDVIARIHFVLIAVVVHELIARIPFKIAFPDFDFHGIRMRHFSVDRIPLIGVIVFVINRIHQFGRRIRTIAVIQLPVFRHILPAFFHKVAVEAYDIFILIKRSEASSAHGFKPHRPAFNPVFVCDAIAHLLQRCLPVFDAHPVPVRRSKRLIELFIAHKRKAHLS